MRNAALEDFLLRQQTEQRVRRAVAGETDADNPAWLDRARPPVLQVINGRIERPSIGLKLQLRLDLHCIFSDRSWHSNDMFVVVVPRDWMSVTGRHSCRPSLREPAQQAGVIILFPRDTTPRIFPDALSRDSTPSAVAKRLQVTRCAWWRTSRA